MTNKALVTGASGFIGSHLTEYLLQENWQVTCLLRPESRIGYLDEDRIHVLRGDMEDPRLLERSVDGQDFVFHLAGRIRGASKAGYEKANHRLTQNLLQACLKKNPGLRRFVFVSSISAAGPSTKDRYAAEDEIPSPNSEYGRSKHKAEKAVREVWDVLPSTIIRPPNVFGPRLPEVEQLLSLFKKRIVPVLKDRGKMTSLIYVHDLNRGIMEAALSPATNKQVYYLTNSQGYSWREALLAFKREVLGRSFYIPLPESLIVVAAWVTDVLKKRGMVKTHFGRRAWKAMAGTVWLFSAEKAKRDFGFTSRYTLEEGIKETADYYRCSGRLSAGRPPNS